MRLWQANLIVFLSLCCWAGTAPKSCQLVTMEGSLAAGDRFEHALGNDLIFRLDPQRFGPKGDIEGWSMSIVPQQKRANDYIYPVNPPLRFNGLQLLGPVYGETTESSLGRVHEARFLLTQEDSDRIWPLVNNALWPYSEPHPDQAEDEYSDLLKRMTLGRLKLSVQDYEADPKSGSIRRIRFRVEFTLPPAFKLNPELKPASGKCSAAVL